MQAGLFFAVPLYLSVCLGLSAIETGIRLLPLSIALLLSAAGIPKVFPNASPRRVVQFGFLSLFASLVVLVGALEAGAGPEIGTALAGAVLIDALTSSFLTGIENNPAVPDKLASDAQVQLASGVPFISDADLQKALEDAGVSQKTADAIVAENADARLAGLRSSMALLALVALIALFFSRKIPTTQPAAQPAPT